MSKPACLLYGVNDTPPLATTLILGLQHAILMASTLIFPMILVHIAHAGSKIEIHILQSVMLFMGITTLALSLGKRFFGSGYLACGIFDPTFISVSIAAIKLGGLPLLYAINYVQSLLQMVFAGVLIPLRRFFPPEIAGLVIFMIGLSIIKIGISNAIGGVDHLRDLQWDSHSCIISFSTLMVMVGVTVWGGKSFKNYAFFIGTIIGLLLSWILGKLHSAGASLGVHHLFSLPHLVMFHPSVLNWDIVLPLVVAVISVSLKQMGILITAQKINDASWVRPDMKGIRKGMFTTACGSFLCSALGGLPQGISTPNMGLAATTHVTSRKLAYVIGPLYIILSFIPAVSAMLTLLPRPVIGAMILYVVSSIMVAGIEVMLSRLIDARKLFVIGIPIMVAIAFGFVPQLQHDVPLNLQPLVASPLTSATILAIILNMLFQIGVKKHINFPAILDSDSLAKIDQQLHDKGAEWGALPNTIVRAKKVYAELVQALKQIQVENKQLLVNVSYDDLGLQGELIYNGDAINVHLDSSENLVDDQNKNAACHQAIQVAKSHVDKLETDTKDGKQVIRFFIEQ